MIAASGSRKPDSSDPSRVASVPGGEDFKGSHPPTGSGSCLSARTSTRRARAGPDKPIRSPAADCPRANSTKSLSRRKRGRAPGDLVRTGSNAPERPVPAPRVPGCRIEVKSIRGRGIGATVPGQRSDRGEGLLNVGAITGPAVSTSASSTITAFGISSKIVTRSGWNSRQEVLDARRMGRPRSRSAIPVPRRAVISPPNAIPAPLRQRIELPISP